MAHRPAVNPSVPLLPIQGLIAPPTRFNRRRKATGNSLPRPNP